MEDTWVGEPSIADLSELLPSETFPALTASLHRAEPLLLQDRSRSLLDDFVFQCCDS